MGHPHWPLFDLEVRTPRLTLRYVDDRLAAELVELVLGGIHDPAVMPFAMPWTDADPEVLGRNCFQFWWRCRAETTEASWDLNLAVIEDGTTVGATSLGARGFPVTRWFETGSWLGRGQQGRGLGTELRVATLHLGFVGLDALVAGTGAFADNLPSIGVTRRLGYAPNGIEHVERRGEQDVIHRFRITREHFIAHVQRDDVEIVGDAPVREMLGVRR
jgi:RimJ/RimL family protein N-acetyltransferase